MTRPAARRLGLAAALLVAGGVLLAPVPRLRAAPREIDSRQVEAAALALRGGRQRMLQHDAERSKRLAILKAERVEALRLNQRGRADALALQIQLLQRQGRVQAAQDRESLRQQQAALSQALRGAPAE